MGIDENSLCAFRIFTQIHRASSSVPIYHHEMVKKFPTHLSLLCEHSTESDDISDVSETIRTIKERLVAWMLAQAIRFKETAFSGDFHLSFIDDKNTDRDHICVPSHLIIISIKKMNCNLMESVKTLPSERFLCYDPLSQSNFTVFYRCEQIPTFYKVHSLS